MKVVSESCIDFFNWLKRMEHIVFFSVCLNFSVSGACLLVEVRTSFAAKIINKKLS